VAWPAWLGWYCFRTEGAWPDTLQAISPTSTNEPKLMRVAQWLKAHAAPTAEGLLFDEDPAGYTDLQIGFYSGFSYERQARRRSSFFEERLAQNRIGYVVRYEGGRLEREGWISVEGARVRFAGQTFEEVPGFERPVHVYRRAP
jgi:hypothetical protein